MSSLLLGAGCVGTSLQTNAPRSDIYLAIAKSPLAVGLSEKQLTDASKTEIDTLEKGIAGLPVKWNSGENNNGSITPGQGFSVGTATCRRYTRIITINGVSRSESATACKGDNGTWSPLD